MCYKYAIMPYSGEIIFSEPSSLWTEEPELYSRLIDRFSDRTSTVQAFETCGRHKRSTDDNEALLDALGDYRTNVLKYALDNARRRPINSIEYFARTSVVEPGEIQIDAGWHAEKLIGSLALISYSDLPTQMITKSESISDVDFDPTPYLIPMTEYQDAYTVYDPLAIRQGINDGVFEIMRGTAGHVYNLETRIHAPAVNDTDRPIPRVFLVTEINYK